MSPHDSAPQNPVFQTFDQSPFQDEGSASTSLDALLDGACVFVTTSIAAGLTLKAPLQWQICAALIIGSIVVAASATFLFRHLNLYDLSESPLRILETERVLRAVPYLVAPVAFAWTFNLSFSLVRLGLLWAVATSAILFLRRAIVRRGGEPTRRVGAPNSRADAERFSVVPPTPTPLHGQSFPIARTAPILKRVIDIVGASVLLLALTPILLLVGIAIRLDSRGPILFRQVRIGKAGCPFRIYKFRSMYADVPAYARSPSTSDDPRITRIGRFLRRLSIDELPQLLNVLAGHMSLVGPRPEMPFIANSYTGSARLRLLATPGVTGLWQISPARAMPIHENLEYDLFYLQHQNFFLDLAIVLRTTTALFRRGHSC